MWWVVGTSQSLLHTEIELACVILPVWGVCASLCGRLDSQISQSQWPAARRRRLRPRKSRRTFASCLQVGAECLGGWMDGWRNQQTGPPTPLIGRAPSCEKLRPWLPRCFVLLRVRNKVSSVFSCAVGCLVSKLQKAAGTSVYLWLMMKRLTRTGAPNQSEVAEYVLQHYTNVSPEHL